MTFTYLHLCTHVMAAPHRSRLSFKAPAVLLYWGCSVHNEQCVQCVFLPVDPIVIVCSTEELDLLKGGRAGEGAGDCWVDAQE